MSNELRQQAIRLLARREHTRVELARKLAGPGTREEIDAVLAELESSHMQSDSRTAEAWLRGNAARLGASSLRHEMERARAIWSRKFGVPPGNAKDWARQARFLQSRGFASDIVRRLLKEPDAGADQ